MMSEDDLFAGLEDQVIRPSTYVDAGSSRRATTYGGCPKCLNEKVGLVIQGGHLVYKDHYVATWGGASRQCLAGGQRICDLPPRDVADQTGLKTPICICNT